MPLNFNIIYIYRVRKTAFQRFILFWSCVCMCARDKYERCANIWNNKIFCIIHFLCRWTSWAFIVIWIWDLLQSERCSRYSNWHVCTLNDCRNADSVKEKGNVPTFLTDCTVASRWALIVVDLRSSTAMITTVCVWWDFCVLTTRWQNI